MRAERLTDTVTLYEGDCLDVLPTLEPGSVDAVITDPPYGEKTHAGARTTRPGVSLTTEKLITFDSVDDAAFLSLCEACVRVSRRWVLMTCDWRHSAAAERSGLPVVRCGVWVKPDGAPQFTGDRPGTGWEAVLILHRPGKKRWNGGGHHAVWVCGVERGNKHPTQKPLRLVREWVRLFTDPEETILDPFAGSGTTGIAAMLEGRKCILIEKDPAYCEVIRRWVRSPSGGRAEVF
jgi:site-specific DNA-methyltransferase (adenine-specific)